ncbi:hypothetical protein LCGC14_1428960 [marine sediment metagenome]|uniref:Haloacid dehalogenase type II n=2 Tax=root TaxID=1 RepID=A0A831QPB2_9FLAO|nr:haloacid dehalogenase type II [Pricia antarctica]
MLNKPKLIVFDVNETLLNLEPLKLKVNHALYNDFAFDLWFSKLLHYSLVETITEQYADFSSIAAATFRMVAQRFEIDIPDTEISAILSNIKNLPPHTDVVEALTLLKKTGHTMVALTNGNQDVADEQLENAGIKGFMKKVFSVEIVNRYKPHSETYNYVLKAMKTSPKDTLLVAAHGWDIVGAQRAGMKTAFVAREGKFIYPLASHPDLTGKTVLEIAKEITQS